jgi:hypothetical protein
MKRLTPPIPGREASRLSAKDRYHDCVKNALIKNGWVITHDPLRLPVGQKDLYVDRGAELLLAAEKGAQRIAVEIKSLLGRFELDDLEKALGQFALYRSVLARREPDRTLFLAVPDDVVRDVFEEPLGQLIVNDYSLRILGFEPEAEVITRWIP